ncbi:MAG: urea ABC transporter permease subunit UrtB [Halioglobus sp.]
MYRLLIGIFLVFSINATAFADVENTLAHELNVLAHAKLSQMPEQIDVLASIDDPRIADILQALLDGNLYTRKTDKKIFFALAGPDRTLNLSDPLEVSDAVSKPSKEYKRIGVNNRMRSQLRTAVSQLRLQSTDEKQRLAAVLRLLNDLDPSVLGLLNQLAETETNKTILEAVYVARALLALEHGDRLEKLAAIDLLSGNLQPVVLNKLLLIVAADANGQRLEADPVIYKRAETAIAKIEGKADFYGFIETTFFGLSLGSVLLLSAVGLAITFGVMGVINMAHGELIMLGAYTTYVVQLLMPDHIEYSLLVAVPTAFVVSGLVGVAIERGIIRFLYGRPLETLLATFGVSLVLQQAVRSIFSPLNRSVATPEWMSGSWQINPLFSLTYNRMYILVFAIIVFVLLLLLLKKTTLGLQFRAVAQNRAMARAMGIRSQWVDAMTFGLGSGVAGIAGVALSQLTNVGPNLGQAYIIDSFMVVVFGGVGNLWGTLVSAFSLGIANKFIEPVAGAVLAKILVLVFIILFIQRNPRGLFPQQGRAVD